MPMLVPLLGLPVASPLMNLFGITNFGFVIFQRWQDLTLSDIWRLTLMTILTIPLGIYLIQWVGQFSRNRQEELFL